MNALLTRIQFGLKRFKHFRKTLGDDYKKAGDHEYTNSHAIPLQLKEKLLNSKKGGDWKKIRELERQSLTPFGRFGKHGFIFQKDKLPTYDIPNVDGFELLPYVEYLAPKLDSKLLSHQKKVNKQLLLKLSGKDAQPQLQSKSVEAK